MAGKANSGGPSRVKVSKSKGGKVKASIRKGGSKIRKGGSKKFVPDF